MGGSESCIQTINVIDVVGRNDITSVFFVRSMKSVRQSGTEKHPPLLLTKRMEKERKKERKKERRKEGRNGSMPTGQPTFGKCCHYLQLGCNATG